MGGGVAPADLLPFLLLGLGLTAPVAALGHGFDDLQAARRAVGRIRDVLAVPPLPDPTRPVVPRGHRVPRFFDPSRGAITLGGADLRDLGGRRLSRMVSFVFQDTVPPRASVAENIALAVPHADREEVVRVARLAHLHGRVQDLPRGYAALRTAPLPR